MSVQNLDTSTISIDLRHPRTQYSEEERKILRRQLAIVLKWYDQFVKTFDPKAASLEDLLKTGFSTLSERVSSTLFGRTGLFPINGMNISCGEATIGTFAMGCRNGGTYNFPVCATTTSNAEMRNIRMRHEDLKKAGLIKKQKEEEAAHELEAKILLLFYVYRAVTTAHQGGGHGVYISSFLQQYHFYHHYLKHLNLYVTELDFNNPNTGNHMTQVVWESRDFILKLLQNEINLERFYFDTVNYLDDIQSTTRTAATVIA